MIQDLLADKLNNLDREAYIYHYKYRKYTRFPFQANLYGLPRKIVDQCISDLKGALKNKESTPRPKNYQEWMYWRFGKGISENLMIPYAEKIWTIPATKMNFDWIHNRVPEPDIRIIEKGAYSELSEKIGIHKTFWYSKSGGIEALPVALSKRVDNVCLNSKVTRICPKEKKIQLNRNEWLKFDRIISSIALPLLISIVDDVPEDVKKAAEELEFNSIVCVCIGVDRSRISDSHWLYFYEDDFIFHRLSFPMNFTDLAVPNERSSICCEIAYSRHRPFPIKGRDNLVQRVIEDLIKVKILRKDDKISVTDVCSMKYTYVIYDLSHRKNVNLVHEYLESQNIYCCGRFGEWEYLDMDHSMMSGQRCAKRINGLS